MGNKFKWYIVVIAFVLTFSGVYLFYNWHQQSLVEEPFKEMISEIEGVKGVEIEDHRENTKIYVTMEKVERLNKVYSNIQEAASINYSEGTYDIKLVDERTEYLEEVYDGLHFALLEGSRKGNYRQMNEEISRILSEKEAVNNYRIFVNNEKIFVQVTTQNGFLYEIIPLHTYDQEKSPV